MRDLLRKRAHLVRQHTANVLSVQNIMVRNTGGAPQYQADSRVAPARLKGFAAEVDQVLAVTSSLAVLDCLSHQIKPLEQTVQKRLKHTPAYTQLLTVDGIGAILPRRLPWKVVIWAAFPRWAIMPRTAAVWIVPNSVMGSAKGKATSKMAIRIWVGHMEAAQFALRFNARAQRFYQRKLAKTNNNTILARKAVAHKLSQACYYIMRDLVPFDAIKAFG